MARFNLEEYEPVEDRLEKFHKDYKEGRVITEMVGYTDDRVVFKASLYRDFDEDRAWATGYAEETRGQGGLVNETSHLENCETSAIGRALANAGYAPKGKRPSREEMRKVAKSETSASRQPATNIKEDAEKRSNVYTVHGETMSEIKRLYSTMYKLYPEAQNINLRVAQMVKEEGYNSLSTMPREKIRELADNLEKRSRKNV